MSTGGGRRNEHQSVFTRQCTILRKNLNDWDSIIRHPRGEDWPKMLGRLNAAMNQAKTIDKSIEDVLEHFVYTPKKCTANPADIPFFLSTMLAEPPKSGEGTGTDTAGQDEKEEGSSFTIPDDPDPVAALAHYENRAAGLVKEYEEAMVRF